MPSLIFTILIDFLPQKLNQLTKQRWTTRFNNTNTRQRTKEKRQRMRHLCCQLQIFMRCRLIGCRIICFRETFILMINIQTTEFFFSSSEMINCQKKIKRKRNSLCMQWLDDEYALKTCSQSHATTDDHFN